MQAAYDDIGIGYARFRQPDPRIEAQIIRALGSAQRILNVGAGSGSYEPVDRLIIAIEPSVEMIRQRPPDAAPCIQGDTTVLRSFGDRAFDAAMAILTVHHWPEPADGLWEMARVAAGVVVFCFDPDLHNRFWLFRDYVPSITEIPSTGGAIAVDTVAGIIGADRVETVPIPHDCADGFGWAYWRRPELYLDPEVRRCISGFGLVPADDVERGMRRLEADLQSGRWDERYGHLRQLDAIDGGFRLVVRDAK